MMKKFYLCTNHGTFFYRDNREEHKSVTHEKYNSDTIFMPTNQCDYHEFCDLKYIGYICGGQDTINKNLLEEYDGTFEDLKRAIKLEPNEETDFSTFVYE